MKCHDMEPKMAEMLAGELAEKAPVEAHLLECAPCRKEFEVAKRGWQAADWPAPAVPARAVAAVRRSIEAPSRAVGLLRYMTAAAAALLLATLSLSTIYMPDPPSPPPVSDPVPATPAPSLGYVSPGVGLMTGRDAAGRPVGELSIARHDVSIEILDGIAKTTIEEVFVNHTGQRLEGTFHFPLPADASISRLAMEIEGTLMEGTCLERERAREVYEGIVRRMCDPALLEWMPGNIFKCRIFPIEAHGEKRVIIAYTQALPYFNGHMRYVYPLASEKARDHALARVSIVAGLKFKGVVRRVDCRSHRADVAMKNTHEATAEFRATNLRPENDFVLDLALDDTEEFTLVPHKKDGEDGYFMVLYTPQGRRDAVAKPRKIAFVVDVSASVSGPELEVSRRVVEAFLDKMGPKDSFTVFAHNVEVTRFEGSKREAIDFLGALKTSGACDLEKGLTVAARENPDEIVYVGEGVPTFGSNDPQIDFSGSLRTIAVGSDAASEVLDRLAQKHNGASFTINPSDAVGSRINEIVSTFGVELITGISVDGGEAVYDLAPAKPRNLYAGERLVVTGRWRGQASKIKIAGREFACAFPVKEEGNNFVRRLWAQRKIAMLLGAGKKDEVVAISVAHQIMTPYTSFLVLENEKAYDENRIKREKQEEDKLISGKSETRRDPFRKDLVLRPRGEAEGKFRSTAGERVERWVSYNDALEPSLYVETNNMRVVIVNPSDGGGTPMTGATFTLIPALDGYAGYVATDRNGWNYWGNDTDVDVSKRPAILGFDVPGVGLTDVDEQENFPEGRRKSLDRFTIEQFGGPAQKRGDLDGAIQDYTRAIEANPRDAEAWSNRASLRYIKGDEAGAVEDYTNALKLHGNTKTRDAIVKEIRENCAASDGALTAKVATVGDDPAVVALDKGAKKGMRKDLLFAITRDRKFVAVVIITEAADDRAYGTVWRGVAIGRIQPGDVATQISDPAAYVAGLPKEVKLDLSSQWNLDRMRSCVELERNADK